MLFGALPTKLATRVPFSSSTSLYLFARNSGTSEGIFMAFNIGEFYQILLTHTILSKVGK
jgi:hypothetical protein